MYRKLGPLAQSVEQRTFNPWVVGSIPTGPTSYNKPIRKISLKPKAELIAGELAEIINSATKPGSIHSYSAY